MGAIVTRIGTRGIAGTRPNIAMTEERLGELCCFL